MSSIKTLIRKIYFVPATTLNVAAARNLSRINEWLQAKDEPRLLNLGCGERFIGSEKLSPSVKPGLINFDLFASPAVDVSGDAHAIPFRDASFHAVITQALLEHTRRPSQVVNEIRRILKTGGLVYAEVPFIQGYHPTPHDYYRYTPEGLRDLFSSFSLIDQGVCGGPGSALGWIFRETAAGILSGFSEKKALNAWGQFVAGWMAFPFKYIDYIYAAKPGAGRIASGLYFLGRKK